MNQRVRSVLAQRSKSLTKPLSELRPGESGTLISFDAQYETQSRLLELGLIPGNKVSMHQKAPLGDPMELEVLHSRICIRKNDAKSFIVEL